MSVISKLGAGALLAIFFVGHAHAVPVAAASMPAQPCYHGASTQNQIQGFSFTPTADLVVTALGVADCNMDGLSFNTPVGLYRGDGTQLIATDMAAGTGAALDGTVRFLDVAPLTLLKDVEYRIFSFMEHDVGEPALLFPDVTFAPQISVNGFFALQDGGFHPNLPGLQFINSSFCCSFFGPSFKFDAAPTSVPEPLSLAVFAAGLLILVGVGLRGRERGIDGVAMNAMTKGPLRGRSLLAAYQAHVNNLH